MHQQMLRSLALWLRRRTDVPAGAATFTYSQAGRGIMIAFLVLSLVELAAVEFLVPWAWLRWTLLVLGVWAVALVAGLMIANTVRPHALTADTLLLRNGVWGEVSVPLEGIATAARSLRSGGKSIGVSDGVATVTPLDSTNIELTLTAPHAVGIGEARKVRFWCDDPARAVSAINAARATAPRS